MGGRILWIIMGIIAIAGGVMAIKNPFAASILATTIAGWMFLFIGILQIIGGFAAQGAGAKIWTILLGVLSVILGVMILGEPLKSMFALTTVVAILFLGGGIAKIILSFSLEDRRFFWLILISGALSVVLGLMIFMNWPTSAVAALGILLGVDLISNGVSALALGFSRDTESSAA